MDRTLSNFIRALRNAEVRVSTAETSEDLARGRAREFGGDGHDPMGGAA